MAKKSSRSKGRKRKSNLPITTVTVSKQTKELLDKRKEGEETWDDFIRRLVE